MAGNQKSVKVDREQFERVLRKLINTKPLPKSKIKIAKRKPKTVLGPQGQQ